MSDSTSMTRVKPVFSSPLNPSVSFPSPHPVWLTGSLCILSGDCWTPEGVVDDTSIMSVPLFVRRSWLSCLSNHSLRVMFVFVRLVLRHMWYCCVCHAFNCQMSHRPLVTMLVIYYSHVTPHQHSFIFPSCFLFCARSCLCIKPAIKESHDIFASVASISLPTIACHLKKHQVSIKQIYHTKLAFQRLMELNSAVNHHK